MYRETGPYKFHEIKESYYLPDPVTAVMVLITVRMVGFLERITGISLFCYLVFNCPSPAIPSQTKILSSI